MSPEINSKKRSSIEEKRIRFLNCTARILTAEREIKSIGELGEKTIHAVVKDYIAVKDEYKEIKVGKYVADIFDGERIYEIQSAGWGYLRHKLDAFLEEYPVTVIYPLPHKKLIIWINPETGELIAKNKSPITGSVYEAFKEFYRIKAYLPHPNLSLRLLLIDMEEYRLADGWSRDKKRGSHRIDRYPLGLVDDILLAGADDFKKLIPDEISEPFTVKELAKYLHVRKAKIGFFVNVLRDMDVIEFVGRKKREYLYKKVGN